MQLNKTEKQSKAIKIEAEKDGKIVGRAYLYLICNDLHQEPYGLLEDVFVEDSERGQGTGTELVKAIIAEAKAQGCTKLIGCSRYSRSNVHEWYKSLGFTDYGKEFRVDFDH
jgi:N-acetylglutamate synthase-like GNAT family acetyltransferase